ncbi:MAG: hypothetical protein IJ928_03130 [Prevotella sp.]|nr:hypothetical protein [Prevotella sp.]
MFFFLMRGFSVGRGKICQDFSWDFCATEDFGRKFQGEIFKISPLNLQDLSPKFAVKLRAIFKSLIINALQFRYKSALFCQDFLPIFAHTAIPLPLPLIIADTFGFRLFSANCRDILYVCPKTREK